MPKVRFATSDARGFKENGNKATYLAIDTSEVVAFQLDKHGDLHLWFKGVSDSITLGESDLGNQENFKKLLLVVSREFPDISEIKLDQ